MPITLDGTNGITTPTYGGADTSEYLVPVTAFKNRIINGAMQIDQRNSGASVSVSNGTITYGADRFLAYEDTSASSCTVQQLTDAPSGFTNSLRFSVGTGGTATASQLAVIEQRIEGFNFADLMFGSASAQTFTLSFWVKSSLTGTYCVGFRNSSDNRSYVAQYTISSANTWEQKSITVAGDITGTWLTTNGIGINVRWDLGSGSTYRTSTTNAWQSGLFFSTSSQANLIGTSSATWQVTGVQLEVGSTATSFDYRPYTTEFQLCQRYYWKMAGNDGGGSYAAFGSGQATDSTTARFYIKHPVQMRSSPTYSYNGTITIQSGGIVVSATSINGTYGGLNSVMLQMTTGSPSFTSGYGVTGYVDTASTSWLASSAEL